MAWIESHQEIGRHPKTRKAARLLGCSIPQVVGHLHLLWHWALDFAQDGDVTVYEAADLADAAMWDGDPQTFYDALTAAGFLEAAGSSAAVVIHDWYDYAGKLIERRKADAARKRSGHSPTDPLPPSGNPPAEFQRSSSGVPADGAKSPSVTVPSPLPNRSTIPPTPHRDAVPPVPPAANAALGVSPPAVSKLPAPAPKPGSNYDFPEVWRLVEADQGYPPVWDYAIETKTLKRLLTAHPGAQPADFARFLAYVGTCWPFCDEPTRQPTFSEGAKHFGAWFTTGQPAQCAEPPPHGRNGHGPTNGYRESTNTQRFRANAEQRAARHARESADQAGALRLLPGARPG